MVANGPIVVVFIERRIYQREPSFRTKFTPIATSLVRDLNTGLKIGWSEVFVNFFYDCD